MSQVSTGNAILWWKIFESFQCLSDFIQNWQDVPITVCVFQLFKYTPWHEYSNFLCVNVCRSNPAL